MNQLELEFRQELTRVMSGLWLPTIHVESHINPGVPDLSYVMHGADCETGWLELKAIPKNDSAKGYRFKLEPSQHRWLEAHHSKVPCHLLLSVGDVCWLVPGVYHRLFLETISFETLNNCSIAHVYRANMRAQLHNHLTKITLRGRNV